jgi:hypothetical protein
MPRHAGPHQACRRKSVNFASTSPGHAQVKLVEGDLVPSVIMSLKRRLTFTKEMWREPFCHRTIAPSDTEPLIKSTWLTNQAELPAQGSLELALHPNGLPQHAPSIRTLQSQVQAVIGVFAVSFISDDRAKVVLSEEECSRQLGIPRRPSRQIALLQPWRPVRVLLNGRTASHWGQHYLVDEYHLTLCTEPMPDRLDAPRIVDLQANLL